MLHIITVLESKQKARLLVNRLVAAGLPREALAIEGATAAFTTRQLVMAFAIVIGVFIAFIMPNYYLTHFTYGLHLLGLTSLRVLAGAATGGALELLLQKTIPGNGAAGRYAVTIEGKWETAQHAQHVFQEFFTIGNKRLSRIVQTHGYEHQSFLSLYDGGQVWFHGHLEAAVVYRIVGRVAIVTAAPIAAPPEWEQTTRAFLQFCAEQNLDCLMLPVNSAFAAVAQDCGMGVLRVGACGYFKLPEWKPVGDRAKKVRAGVNQARSAGITVKPFVPATEMDQLTRTEIEQLCQQWLASREINALGWLLELNPFKLAEHKRYFLACNTAGRLEGMLACSPFAARRGWYLEDLLRRPEAPRGVSELLVVEALKHLAAEGAELATLGTSPLADVQSEGQFNWLATVLHFLYEHFETFYHFKKLHRFKTKFAPSYVDAEYIAVWPPRVRLRLIQAIIKVLNPNGLKGMMMAKLSKLWLRTKSKTLPPRSFSPACGNSVTLE